jgi:heme o synthase
VRNDLGWPPIVLFGAMFFWTPPHFWALAIKYADDYRAANVPMLPAVVPFEHAVRQMIGHTVAMVACTLVLAPVAELGALYLASAVVLGALFLSSVLWLSKRPTPANSMRVFGFSISYVTLLFAAMSLDILL